MYTVGNVGSRHLMRELATLGDETHGVKDGKVEEFSTASSKLTSWHVCKRSARGPRIATAGMFGCQVEKTCNALLQIRLVVARKSLK